VDRAEKHPRRTVKKTSKKGEVKSKKKKKKACAPAQRDSSEINLREGKNRRERRGEVASKDGPVRVGRGKKFARRTSHVPSPRRRKTEKEHRTRAPNGTAGGKKEISRTATVLSLQSNKKNPTNQQNQSSPPGAVQSSPEKEEGFRAGN